MTIHDTCSTFEMSTDGGESFQEIDGGFTAEITADASRFDSAMFKMGEAIEGARTAIADKLIRAGDIVYLDGESSHAKVWTPGEEPLGIVRADVSALDSMKIELGQAFLPILQAVVEPFAATLLDRWICPGCGTLSPIGADECRGCGTGLAGDICPWCGRHHTLDRKTCWNGWAGCGGELH